jgi:hypothetical protein
MEHGADAAYIGRLATERLPVRLARVAALLCLRAAALAGPSGPPRAAGSVRAGCGVIQEWFCTR